jgi:two-component system nitrogen regulation response regulator NtrX
MSLKTQSKVLRTLDEQKFTPVGDDDPVKVDVRVIAATNKDLDEEISRGNFREDLFYRLNVIPFYVPPLRERKEDIPLLSKHFLKEFSAAYSRRSREITDEAIETLTRYSWPGNVRELRNVVERSILFAKDGVAGLDCLPADIAEASAADADIARTFTVLSPPEPSDDRATLERAMRHSGGNLSSAAVLLGISRSTLYRRMDKLGLNRYDPLGRTERDPD